jgi:hypothetical protein
VQFDYTIANDASVCRDVYLGLTLYNTAQPGSALNDPSHDKVVAARPGTHSYHRRFTIPASAAGQRFDVAWSVADPQRTQTYGVDRVRALIAVAGR